MRVGVFRCHGRDISIKSSKTKKSALVVLPIQFAIASTPNVDVQIGSIIKSSTKHPEFVFTASNVSVRNFVATIEISTIF